MKPCLEECLGTVPFGMSIHFCLICIVGSVDDDGLNEVNIELIDGFETKFNDGAQQSKVNNTRISVFEWQAVSKSGLISQLSTTIFLKC